MGEQKINVKSTYVATVKKDVADRSVSFYANEKKGAVFSNESVFPEVPSTPEVAPEPVVSAPAPTEVPVPEEVTPVVEETTPVPSAPVEAPVIPEPTPVPTPEPVVAPVEPKVEELPGIPNLDVLNPMPEIPAEPVSQPMPEVVVNPAPIPNPTPVVPGPIPNPVPEPVAPTPVTDTFASVESMVNEVSQKANEAPAVVFDASHETNLLGALGDANNQPSMGNINVTPDNLNVVREFGVDEPIVTDQNGQPVPQPKMGFVNSKVLLILVVVFFLASCVFLGYEIYKYVTLPK